MGRTVDIAGVEKGMKIRTVVEGEVVHISETRSFITIEIAGTNYSLPAGPSFEVISEAPVAEPSPGSVVRTPDNDMYCRIESDRGSWQRVDGTGLAWTWDEILRLGGKPKILFDPEADMEHGGVPTHIEGPADWDNGDPELRKYPWVDGDFDAWTWSPTREIWWVANGEGCVRHQATNLADMATFPITRAAQASSD